MIYNFGISPIAELVIPIAIPSKKNQEKTENEIHQGTTEAIIRKRSI